jgi:nucleoside phosphorylase/tetratricopeptide (TPR) repeat protein
MSRAVNNRIIVVLVTALKDEYDQVLAVEAGAIGQRWVQAPGLDGRLVATRRFRAADGGTLEIIATWATEMGGVITASLATSLIEKYNPHCISMCGICAGRRGKVSLGDVIFGERLWTYDLGKTVVETAPDGKPVERFFGDMFQYRLPERWKQRVQAYKVGEADWLELRPLPLQTQGEWVLLRLFCEEDPQTHSDRKTACPDWTDAIAYLRRKKHLKKSGLSLTRKGKALAEELRLVYVDGLPRPEDFQVHLAPIGTGSQVIEDPNIFERLSSSMRKVLGLEMEASAIGAVGDLKEVPAIVAKGVSDYADEKDDRFRKFAARASAECLIGFMRASLPRLVRVRHPSAASIQGSDTSAARSDQERLGRGQPNLLPRDIVSFTGRTSQLDDLIQELAPKWDSPHPTAVAIDAIDGMAGIGKTALAVHLAHLITPDYPDAQLFIDLHGYTPGRLPVTPAAALDRLLRALGIPPSRIPEDLDERAALWRSEIAGMRALIVLDNANSHEQVRPLLPGVPGSCVVITSRRRLAGLEGIRELALDVLPKKEAIALFRRIVGQVCSQSTDQTVGRLVHLCGYLPLAIQLVGNRWRNRASWRIEDLLKRLTDARTRLSAISAESIEIATAFEVSYKNLNGAQRQLFRRLGLHPGIDITTEAAAVLLGCDVNTAEKLLDDLFDHSLINEPERARYRFHDLLRDYARQQATTEESLPERSASQLRLLHYYLCTINEADSILDPHRRRFDIGLVSASVPMPAINDHRSAHRWLEAERLNALACVRLAAENGENLIVCQLASVLAHFMFSTGYNRESYDLHRQAWEAAKKISDPSWEASALTDLGRSCQAAGDFEHALEFFGQALKLWVIVDNKDGRARTLNGIGFTLERTGDYEKALTHLDEALGIRRAIKDSYGEAHVLNAMGAVHWRLQQYDEALMHFDAALSIRRKIKDRYGEARTVNNIGFTHQRLGDYGEATKWLNEALKIASDLGDRNSEAVTLNNLSYTFGPAGSISEGLEYAWRGLETARMIGSLYEEGRALDAMAKCEALQADMEAANRHWEAALLIFEKIGVPEAHEVRISISRTSLDKRPQPA